MPNKQTDPLFQLIKSLNKAEKRNFKLYAQRNTSAEDLKTIQLFDGLDKLALYDEDKLLLKQPALKKQQLSNLKSALYKQIMGSLRLLEDKGNIDIQLHEQMDYARILFNKGLYLQSLKLLEKIKELASSHHQVTFWLQALIFEKKIESLYITRSFENRAEVLSMEVEALDNRLVMIGKLSNLSLQLYGWYIKNGHTRTKVELGNLKQFFHANLPANAANANGFYEKMYLYQSYVWYHFIQQDFLAYYKYTQRWIDLFHQYPVMQQIEALYYIKALHNLLNAHYTLGNCKAYVKVLNEFAVFYESPVCANNDNNKTQAFIYLYTGYVNQHFLEGSFSKGIELIDSIEGELKNFSGKIDRHRELVFYYKFACLHFGSGHNEEAIRYLNKIINWRTDLRSDLQCYARLLLLIAHFELGNYNLLEYLLKSVYRFMAKMENMSRVEEEMFAFLRQSFSLKQKDLKKSFQQLLLNIKQYEGNRIESRAFAYLDVIGWLESKIKGIPVEEIIQQRFKKSKK